MFQGGFSTSLHISSIVHFMVILDREIFFFPKSIDYWDILISSSDAVMFFYVPVFEWSSVLTYIFVIFKLMKFISQIQRFTIGLQIANFVSKNFWNFYLVNTHSDFFCLDEEQHLSSSVRCYLYLNLEILFIVSFRKLNNKSEIIFLRVTTTQKASLTKY